MPGGHLSHHSPSVAKKTGQSLHRWVRSRNAFHRVPEGRLIIAISRPSGTKRKQFARFIPSDESLG